MKLFAVVFAMYGMTMAAPVAQPEEGSDSHVAREPLGILPPLSLPLPIPLPTKVPTVGLPPVSVPTLGVPTLALPPLSIPTGLPTVGLPPLSIPTGVLSVGLPTLSLPHIPTAAPTLPGVAVPSINLGTLPGHKVSTALPPVPTSTGLPDTSGLASELAELIEKILSSQGTGLPAPILLLLQTVQGLLKDLGL